MRFLLGVIVLFLASFGAVFLFGSPAKAPLQVDIATFLKTQPEEYSRIYIAVQVIGTEEIEELDRSLVAFGKHENETTLRRDVGGVMLRVISNKRGNLKNAGRLKLEKVVRKTLGLLRRQQKYGWEFCDATIQNDHASAEKILRRDLLKKEADALIVEFKQVRFELATEILETVAEATRDPIGIPPVDEQELELALFDSVSREQAKILKRLNDDDEETCEGAIALFDAALGIRDEDKRHAMLAVMMGQD